MKFKERFTVKFKIKKILFDDFVAVQILDTGDFECETNGCFLSCEFSKIYEGDVFSCDCIFLEDEKNGYILKALDIPKLEIPSSEVELAKYISSQIRGISKDAMMKAVKILGTDIVSLVNNNPKVLDDTALKDSQKESLIEWCGNHFNIDSMISEGYLKGLSPTEVFEAYRQYGYKSIRLLKDNPYALYLYGVVSFDKIDRIAIKSGIEKDSLQRTIAQVFHLIELYEDTGSMAMLKEDIYSTMIKKGFSDASIWNSLDFLMKENFIEKAEFDDKVYYGKRNNMFAERVIADHINNVKDKEGYSYEVIDANFKGSELNKQQKEAVYGCLSKKYSLLTGGPGTGKTFTIKRIIRTVKNINPNIKIALMAPTGKAASRMVEVINMNATTIHAAFGISEGDDLIKKDGMVLNDDLIIIDEASMIDEKLFSYFCRHVNKNTQVILVGDTGQLPSVEAGNLLDSLSKVLTNYELTTICRQDKTSPIVLNAHKIRNKEFDDIVFDNDTFRFIETDNIIDVVRDLYERYMFEEMPENVMILSPQHNRIGTDQINLMLQKENSQPVIKVHYRNKFKKDDRVIQLKNVKKLDIHNGDQGRVIGATDKGIIVQFDGKEDETEVTDLDNIELAYAITVHKSQGSEAEVVIMIFNTAHMFTLSNKLIYTALTRTKTTFIGVGSKEAFYKGCKKESTNRISLINNYIKKYEQINANT